MKVLQVLPALGSGGVERTTLEMVEALVAAGHRAYVASSGGPLAAEIAALGGEILTLPLGSKNPLVMRQTAKDLTHIIRNEAIDIVHARSRAPAYPARWAARKTGVKFLTTYHGIYNAKSGLKRRYNSVMASGDHTIANSEFTKAHIIKEHGTDPNRITAIPRGVDLARFPDWIEEDRLKTIRAYWGVAENARVLFLPGRLTRLKGQTIAIEAMKDIENFTLIIQGDAQGRDGYKQELIDLSQTLPEGRVKIVEPHDDIAAAYRAAFGALSISTKPESFGRTTAEASAMGTPVIASAHGGSIEITDNGRMALMAVPGDAASLNTQIKTLTAMRPDQAAEFAKAGQMRARTLYTKRAMCDATLSVYEKLLIG